MKTTRLFKNILPAQFIQIRKLLFPLLLITVFRIVIVAQCPAGYSTAVINWDNLDYLHSNSSYSAWVSAAMRQTQYFAIGTNRLTINTSIPVGSSGTIYGDVPSHTGEAGSYGSGDDIKYMGDGTITMTFQSAVQNVNFSFYDIDYDQRITVTALNGAIAQNITMNKVSGTVLTVTGSGTTSANVKATTTALANNSTDGTSNISIAGPLTSITVTITETNTKSNGPASGQEDGGFFLSDITACVADPGFPNNYYSSYTQPFTGQPSYFLANPQNLHVYMVNAANGVADYIFSDPGTGGNKMNSLAYDPVNKWLYYVMDNAPAPGGPANNKTLKKYDFNTGTISTVIADITTLGIPTFVQGIEFGGAAFYNGSLYLGLEGSDGINYFTNGESIVWRIDFNGSGIPTQASQVFGTPGDDGSGTPTHDWGDFIIKDGMIISQAINGFSSNHYKHVNMQTNTVTTYAGNAESAGQMGQIWNGNVYRVKNNVALYNNDGTIGSLTPITLTSCSPAWSGNAGDASDPFKPKCDFGDAPASYDPVALSPAANQKACNNSILRIGAAWGDEWSKYTSVDASGDADEDGISTVTVMISDGVAYNHVQEVTVLNNTGATAYLAGWLDYNANGIFEASEGVVVTVPTSASPQVITLGWINITVASGTPNTFLRVRLYSGALTTSNSTGWFSDGETEDYPVVSSAVPLLIDLLDFNAVVTYNKNVLLNWRAYADKEASGFVIERSRDQNSWQNIGWIDINTEIPTADYSFLDQQPYIGKSYYRLKMVEKSGSSKYSNTRIIQIDQLTNNIRVYPNPVKNNATIAYTSLENQTASLQIRSLSGAMITNKSVILNNGDNRITIDLTNFPDGIYIAELITQAKKYINKFTVLH